MMAQGVAFNYFSATCITQWSWYVVCPSSKTMIMSFFSSSPILTLIINSVTNNKTKQFGVIWSH